jgi:hypothetical protein
MIIYSQFLPPVARIEIEKKRKRNLGEISIREQRKKGLDFAILFHGAEMVELTGEKRRRHTTSSHQSCYAHIATTKQNPTNTVTVGWAVTVSSNSSCSAVEFLTLCISTSRDQKISWTHYQEQLWKQKQKRQSMTESCHRNE